MIETDENCQTPQISGLRSSRKTWNKLRAHIHAERSLDCVVGVVVYERVCGGSLRQGFPTVALYPGIAMVPTLPLTPISAFVVSYVLGWCKTMRNPASEPGGLRANLIAIRTGRNSTCLGIVRNSSNFSDKLKGRCQLGWGCGSQTRHKVSRNETVRGGPQ